VFSLKMITPYYMSVNMWATSCPCP